MGLFKDARRVDRTTKKIERDFHSETDPTERMRLLKEYHAIKLGKHDVSQIGTQPTKEGREDRGFLGLGPVKDEDAPGFLETKSKQEKEWERMENRQHDKVEKAKRFTTQTEIDRKWNKHVETQTRTRGRR